MSRQPTIGSLFTGIGGLDEGVRQVFGGQVAWTSETDPHAAPEHNLGDITKIDWGKVDPVDIVCGGSPCQDLSTGGAGTGLHGHRSALWFHMLDAIKALRPHLVVWENVYGALSASGGPNVRAAGRVIGTLAENGYDAAWTVTGSKNIGAPHNRRRLFLLAWDKDAGPPTRWRPASDGDPNPHKMLPTPTASDSLDRGAQNPHARKSRGHQIRLVDHLAHQYDHESGHFGVFEQAIRHWGSVVGPPPAPLLKTRTGNHKMNPPFAAWMMGLDAPPDDVAWKDRMRLIGNAAMPAQVAPALAKLAATAQREVLPY